MHRYFWPDTPPYATLLREIAGRLHHAGHEVEVLSAQPSYKPAAAIERQAWRGCLDGFAVHRVRAMDNSRKLVKAAAGHASFVLLAFAAVARGKKPDVVMCSTVPPILLAAALSIGAKTRGSGFIYHCMDLHPDVSLTGDRLSLLQRLMRRVDTATCRRSDVIVVLSEDMKRTLIGRSEELADKIEVINNFDLRDLDQTQISDPPPRDGRLRVVFTGNLGRFQDLLDITRSVVASRLAVELVFMGDGAVAGQLRAMECEIDGGPAVRVLSHGSTSSARALMRSADLGLVSLMPGVIRNAYPSKTITYWAEGLPVLAVVDGDSELASAVRDRGLGVQTSPGDPVELVDVLRRLCDDRSSIEGMRSRVREYASSALGREMILDQWADVFAQVAASNRRGA